MKIDAPAVFGVVVLAVSLAVAQNAAPPQPNSVLEKSELAAASSDTEDVALGEPFEWAPPKYPKQARKAQLQGTVVLMLKVNEEGYVSGGTVVSGDPRLAQAAIDIVRKWQYVPYELSERPTAVTTKATFVFSISEGRRPEVAVEFRHPPKPDLGPVFKVSNGVTAPKPLYSPEPQYSEKARQAKYQGVCILRLIVGPDGKTYDIKIDRSLGAGLDVKAIEAVRKWRFQPALKDGNPVAVTISVEIDFRLY